MLQLVLQGKFLVPQVDPHGLQGLLEQQVLSMMLFTVTVHSWQLVLVELPFPLQMEHPGELKLVELLTLLMELPMETVFG